jgi:single-stranded DNA-binding protein
LSVWCHCGTRPSSKSVDCTPRRRADIDSDRHTVTSFTKDGERQERVDWPTIVCWNGLAKSCRQLAKGDRVAVAGVLRTHRWVDEDATHRRVVKTTEIHASDVEFLDVKARREAKGE